MRPTDDRQRPRQNLAADGATQLDPTLAGGTIVPEPDDQDATLNSENREPEDADADDGGTLGACEDLSRDREGVLIGNELRPLPDGRGSNLPVTE